MYRYEEELSGIYLKQPVYFQRFVFFSRWLPAFCFYAEKGSQLYWQNDWFDLLIVGGWKKVSCYYEWNK